MTDGVGEREAREERERGRRTPRSVGGSGRRETGDGSGEMEEGRGRRRAGGECSGLHGDEDGVW